MSLEAIAWILDPKRSIFRTSDLKLRLNLEDEWGIKLNYISGKLATDFRYLSNKISGEDPMIVIINDMELFKTLSV